MANKSKARRASARALQSKIAHKKALQAADTSDQPTGIDSAVKAYFNDPEVVHSRPLSRAEERELCIQIQAGSLEARDKLVRANLRFVVDVARNFQHRGLPLADLIAIGNTGVIIAALRFDGTRGNKFITYAVWWIRQVILEVLAKQVRTVYVPLNIWRVVGQIGKNSPALTQRLERDPSAEELSRELEIEERFVQTALEQSQPVASLDEPVRLPSGQESKLTGIDVLLRPGALSPEQELLNQEAKAVLLKAVRALPEREQRVLVLYFGLDGGRPLTLEKIGGRLGVTRERVRQIRDKGLARLRGSKNGSLGEGLREYYLEA